MRLVVRDAGKRYGGIEVLSGVCLTAAAGEIHALVGENGAGKSTLCKAISGAVALDSGEIVIDGVVRSTTGPAQARRAGVAMVYQETSLIPSMTVAQNLLLGDEPMTMRMSRVTAAARQLLNSLNFHVSPTAYVSSLTGAQRQLVEIARGLRQQSKLMILDEPTASLTPEEKRQLFDAVRRLADDGVTVLYVSHALEESLDLADRISVLRDGRLRATVDAGDIDRPGLVRLMVGRTAEFAALWRPLAAPSQRRPVLRIDSLRMGNQVNNLSMTAYAGEVTGVAGLVGSGRSEAMLAMIGALKRDRRAGGSVWLGARRVRYRTPRRAVLDGIVYVTEDRKRAGFFDTMSIADNVQLGAMAQRRRVPLRWSRRAARRRAAECIERFQITAPGPDSDVVGLSGGNQQKVVVAKALSGGPTVAIFDEPTRGVDVGAIEEIHAQIRALADRGVAVVVISSYLPEVMALSDRILVARAGRIVAELDPATADEEQIMFAAVH